MRDKIVTFVEVRFKLFKCYSTFYDNTGFNKGDEFMLRRKVKSSLMVDRYLADGIGEEMGHKKEGNDPIFDVNVIKYLADEDFIIKQRVTVDEDVSSVTGFLTFMACDDTKCLPPTDVDFAFALEGQTPTLSISGISATDQPINSNIEVPVIWSYEITAEGNDEYLLKYIATAEDGWSVYSQFTNDDGPVPTSILYEEGDHFEILDIKTEKGKQKVGIDPYFDVEVIKYLSGEPFIIEHRVKINDPEIEIKGGLEFMACDDTKCLPPDFTDFYFKPKLLKGGPVVLSQAEVADIAAQGNTIDNTIPTIIASLENPTAECGGIQELSTNLWLTFFFGFIGGLLALLTPCVFPMIPLTVSFFTKDTKRKGWMNGLIYGASIIVIYVSLGILLTAVFGADSLNRLSTNWIANTLFFLVFIFFAFSFTRFCRDC